MDMIYLNQNNTYGYKILDSKDNNLQNSLKTNRFLRYLVRSLRLSELCFTHRCVDLQIYFYGKERDERSLVKTL